jgi:hypothetical protein
MEVVMRIIRVLAPVVIVAVAVLFAASCDRTLTTVEEHHTAQNCFNCHGDDDLRIVNAEGQWSRSKHASGENIDRNEILYGTPCVACHTSEGFVAKASGEEIPALVENPTAIHCFTCHAPHTNADFVLRVTSPQDLANGDSYDLGGANICSACHHALADVSEETAEEPVGLSTHWGPHHGVQSDMLLATNGYEYTGYQYEDLDYHRTLGSDGCLECHFATPGTYGLGDHSFNMVLGMEGEEDYNVEGCNNCHSGFEDFSYKSIQDSVATLMEDLHTLLMDAGLVDDTGHPLEGRSTSADSAGAVWNFLMAEEDRSHGVHNSKYIIGLLQSSIDFLQPGGTPGVDPSEANRQQAMSRTR